MYILYIFITLINYICYILEGFIVEINIYKSIAFNRVNSFNMSSFFCSGNSYS